MRCTGRRAVGAPAAIDNEPNQCRMHCLADEGVGTGYELARRPGAGDRRTSTPPIRPLVRLPVHDRRPLAGWSAPGSRTEGGLGSRITRQEPNNGLSHAGEIGAQAHQHLGGHTLAFAHQSEEHVLGADVVVAQLDCLPQ